MTIDLTPPGVPRNLKVQTPTRNNTPEWTWDAADNPDGDLTGCELLLDEAVVIDAGDVLSYTHSEMLSDGMHTMRVRSYDRLGDPSAWTDPATSVLVDATPPDALGMLTVTIRVGNSVTACAYRVLSERTGFGFGRLRPW